MTTATDCYTGDYYYQVAAAVFVKLFSTTTTRCFINVTLDAAILNPMFQPAITTNQYTTGTTTAQSGLLGTTALPLGTTYGYTFAAATSTPKLYLVATG
jgi:hypothetical protein